MILDRLESKALEIALFGRVSSGKSSLLNYIVQSDVLPVGVNPITRCQPGWPTEPNQSFFGLVRSQEFRAG